MAQARDGAADGGGRVVELMGQAGGDRSQTEQARTLPENLLLTQRSESVTGQQMHRHRKLGAHEAGEAVCVEDEEAGRSDQADRDFIDLLCRGHVGRPCPAVRSALGCPMRLHVDARRSSRHHQLTVDQHVETAGCLALGEQHSFRERLDASVGAQDSELFIRELLEQEQGAQLVGIAQLAHAIALFF